MFETIAALLAAHRAGRSPAETVRTTYRRIAAQADPAIFIALRPEADAIADAEALQDRDPVLPLFGIPFAIKDNIDLAGLPTTAACPDFAFQPEHSATVVQRLVAAGAIPIGKTNLDQFATGLVGMRSPYGVPRNVLRADLVPGGSSSGSAVAVAAGLVPFSLGTDTAGSGRVPAALNGIVGLKPTLGLLSTSGVLPACRTLDCVSIFARSIEDALAVLRVAEGPDAADPYSRRFVPGFRTPDQAAPRLAVPDAESLRFFGDAVAEAAFAADCAALAAAGARISTLDLAPFHEVARLLYGGPWVAERYAAIRSFIESRPEALHPVTRAITESARGFSAASTFEALYELQRLRRTTELLLEGTDALVVPSIPTIYTRAELEAEPILCNSNLGTYTNFVNLLDLAAISIPLGRRTDGLPSSVTLIGRAGSDRTLAALAANALAGRFGTMPLPAPQRLAPVDEPPIELAVVGAHLSGMPLNRDLVDLGATFMRAVATTPDYRFFALPGTTPPKPGLVRVADGSGHAIETEVWSLPAPAFGLFVSCIPAPLGIGSLRLADGSMVKGFLCEALAVEDARDISSFGSWRAFMASAAR